MWFATLHCIIQKGNPVWRRKRTIVRWERIRSINPWHGTIRRIKEACCTLVTVWSGRMPALAYESDRRSRGIFGTRNSAANVAEKGVRVIIRGIENGLRITFSHTHTHTLEKVDTRRRTRRGPRSDRVEGRYSTAAARKAHPPPRPPPVYFPDATFSLPSDRYRRAGHRRHVALALPSQRHPRFHLTSLVSPPFSPSPGTLLFLSFPSSHVYIARSLAVSLSRVL